MENLPAVNASLNALSAICLAIGYYYIRRGNQTAHRNAMLMAFGFSALFLVSYLTYHTYVSYVLKRGPTIFREPEWFRPIYLVILLTHTVLAAAVVPMALMTLWRAWKGRFEAHRKLARWTWPIWIYVSITGVLIYLLLYVIFEQSPP
jgi:uncharacterized membrane protein YozB (DUF420 family)